MSLILTLFCTIEVLIKLCRPKTRSLICDRALGFKLCMSNSPDVLSELCRYAMTKYYESISSQIYGMKGDNCKKYKIKSTLEQRQTKLDFETLKLKLLFSSIFFINNLFFRNSTQMASAGGAKRFP